jgi:predicted transcriptional regulator YheO
MPRQASKDQVVGVLTLLVEPLACALGPRAEVVLHDLRRIDHSVVAISGGLTERKPGAPPTDLLLQHLQAGRNNDLYRYHTTSKAGRRLQSSTIFARDDRGAPFACLCINVDITEWLELSVSLGELLEAGVQPESAGHHRPVENFLPDVADLVADAVNEVIAETAVPVELMRKHHRVEVITRLEKAGLFLVQDAVPYVAAALGISRYTVYKYLREVTGESHDVAGDRPSRRATAQKLPVPQEAAT